MQMTPVVQDSNSLIEAYWAAHPNFICPMTHCRILRTQCWEKQCKEKPKRQSYGTKRADNPFDAKCRSNTCEEGLKTQKLLKVFKAVTPKAIKKLVAKAKDPKSIPWTDVFRARIKKALAKNN